MIVIEDIWTAIDRGYEEIAQNQLDIAKKSRVSGSVLLYDNRQRKSTGLLAYLLALEELALNHTIEQNKLIEKLYNNIKTITKDLRRWD